MAGLTDIYIESLQFLSRDDLDVVQVTSAFLSNFVVTNDRFLALREISVLEILHAPNPASGPFQVTMRNGWSSMRRRRRAMPVLVCDAAEATNRLRRAHVAHVVVERMPRPVVQQILTAVQMGPQFTTGTLHYGSYLQSPAPLLNAVQCKHLQWHTLRASAYVKNFPALLHYCAGIGVTNIDFERLYGRSYEGRILMTDECVVNFVSDSAANGYCALRSNYNGNARPHLLPKLVQEMNNGQPVATLCLDIRAPNQDQDIDGGIRDGTDDNWTMRIDTLQLRISWSGGRLRITKNHSPGQYCSCNF